MKSLYINRGVNNLLLFAILKKSGNISRERVGLFEVKLTKRVSLG